MCACVFGHNNQFVLDLLPGCELKAAWHQLLLHVQAIVNLPTESVCYDVFSFV